MTWGNRWVACTNCKKQFMMVAKKAKGMCPACEERIRNDVAKFLGTAGKRLSIKEKVMYDEDY